jgi:GNAT superfamily N-acetyltransferase
MGSINDIKYNIRLIQKKDLQSVLERIAETMLPEDVKLAEITFHSYFNLQNREDNSRRFGFIPGENYVAEIRGKIIGVSGFYIYHDSYWLGWFIVDPEFQRLGIGKELLGKVEMKVKELGANDLFLYTNMHPKFKKARKFYKKMGYNKTDDVDHPRFGDDIIFLFKQLKI